MRQQSLLFLALFLLSYTPAVALRLHSSSGDVDFNHEEHKMYVQCQTCHHAEKEDCSSCHPKTNAFSRSKIFHLLCRSCHKREKTGPTDCRHCHQSSSHSEPLLGE
ncbi:MAG: hypothetical protein J7K75_04845 [Desulfuromonas sp.]|nr:hypothetical protein [Desulfuromonas sp.]